MGRRRRITSAGKLACCEQRLETLCLNPDAHVASLKLGCCFLDSLSCARLALSSHALHIVATSAVRDRIYVGLGGSFVADDALKASGNPLLTLSHLESLAHTSFMFGAARDVCRAAGAARGSDIDIWLLDVSGGARTLCKALLSQVFMQEQKGDLYWASSLANLSALIYHFDPPVRWLPDMYRTLQRGGSTVLVSDISDQSSTLQDLLHGFPNLLPLSCTGKSIRSGKFDTGKLICQLIDRLTFPLCDRRLVLQLSASRAQGTLKLFSVDQPSDFKNVLATLEAEVLSADCTPFDLWILETGGRVYLLLVEDKIPQQRAV